MNFDPREIDKARRTRPPLTRREIAVLSLAGIVLVLAPLGWAGVVLWTVAAGLGFATAALLAAVGSLGAQRGALVGWFFGIILGFFGASAAGAEILSSRWLDYLAFPLAAFIGTGLALFLLSGDLRSRPAENCRRDLFRLSPFWAGLALFAYFAVQDFNAWGVAVDREAFWAKQGIAGIEPGSYDIRPLAHVSWLPSGLEAPFTQNLSTELQANATQLQMNAWRLPMNAWRLMMIIGAPWLLFCALRCGLRRRRGYVILGWITVLAACAHGLGGFFNQYSDGTILGFPVPYNTTCFGPFINHNHAGIYLYLNAAIALALTCWHIRRAGDNALRGGPHLVSAFLALFLALIVALTNSMGAAGVVLALGLVSVPSAYFIGFTSSRNSVREITIVTLFALIFAALALLFTVDLKSLGNKYESKVSAFKATGSDDRAPFRRSTWALATEGGWSGRVWVGYGAGSYRWVSPPYQAKEPALLDKDGNLAKRAIYAHNDWLQMLAEWGIIGLLPVVLGLGWLLGWVIRAFQPGHAEAIPLACVLVLLLAHAYLDLIFWFTPLMFAAAFVAAAMIAFIEQSTAESADITG